jgi:hypothetical protein
MRPRAADLSGNGVLTVNVTPAIVTFALAPLGIAHGSTGVTITTSWQHVGQGVTLNLYGYFSQASAALTNSQTSTALIPSSAVLGQVTTGVPTSYTSFAQTVPFGGAGAGLTLVNSPSGTVGNTSSRTDVLNLEINLSGVSNVAAGTYTGTLTIQASMY